MFIKVLRVDSIASLPSQVVLTFYYQNLRHRQKIQKCFILISRSFNIENAFIFDKKKHVKGAGIHIYLHSCFILMRSSWRYIYLRQFSFFGMKYFHCCCVSLSFFLYQRMGRSYILRPLSIIMDQK